jgi:hypothetical protein
MGYRDRRETDRRDKPPRDSLEGRAHRRVNRKLRFYMHVLVFVLVNGGLLAFHWFQGHPLRATGMLWGWGIGLAIHGIVTFISLQGEGLRERMIREEIERMRRKEE